MGGRDLLEAFGGQAQAEERIRQRLQHILEQMGVVRRDMTPEEMEALAEEERAAAEKDVDAVGDASACVCCLTKQRAIVLQPCRHLVTCHKCTVLLRRMGKCPLCRERIADVKVASNMSSEETVFAP